MLRRLAPLAFAALGAENAVVVGGARERGEDLLAVDQEAAVDRLRLGAERDRAGGRRAAFRERLRVDRALLDDAPVVHRRGARCARRGPPALISRSSASAPVHSVEQTCMFQDSAVAPQ